MQCKIPTFPHEYYENDTRPDLVMVIKSVDLSIYNVEMRLKDSDGIVSVKPSVVITESPEYSQHKWVFVPGDLKSRRMHAIVRLVSKTDATDKKDIAEFYIPVRVTH